jgi:signal transduction histidine kinase
VPGYTIPKAWPAIIALAVVVAMAVSTLVVDVVVERGASKRASELVNDAMRSVSLVDDMRYQAHRLTDAQQTPATLAEIIAALKVDSLEYEPIANYPGERDEWRRLEGLLAQAQNGQVRSGSPVLAQIGESASQLVAINQRAAENLAAEISGVYRSGLLVDLVLGTFTVSAAFVIAMLLRYGYRQQRELVSHRIAVLDERTRELEAFAGRVSHDVKGPLAPIVFTADRLAAHQDPEVREASSRIHRSARKLVALVDNLLALSVSGHPPPGKTAVEPVVTETLDELKPELRDAVVDVSVDDSVAACPSQVLSQLLHNLIENAAKYRSPDRRLELHIDAKHEAEGHGVKIAVGDNGLGMDEETRQHAFDPFFRARETRDTAGHGLGLAIVKRTVETLGGSCTLTSMLGQGTEVTLHLPAA